MKNDKKKPRTDGGVTVRFELIDDYDENYSEILAEKTFPNAKFDHVQTVFSDYYECFDQEVDNWVYETHIQLNSKYHYVDYDNCPNVLQRFYNADGELMYYEDEVNYEYNL